MKRTLLYRRQTRDILVVAEPRVNPITTIASGSSSPVLVLAALFFGLFLVIQTERELNSVDTGQHFRLHGLLFQRSGGDAVSKLPDAF